MVKKIWFILTAIGTGGAEKRALKIAAKVSQNEPYHVNFVLPELLYKEYLNDPDLKAIINESNIKFNIYDKSYPDKIKNSKKYLNVLFSYKKYIPTIIVRKMAVYLSRNLIHFLLRHINNGDIIHHFIGDPSLIAVIMCAKNKTIATVLETPGTGISGEKNSYYLKLLNHNLQNLSFMVVSEIAYSNFIGHLLSHKFNKAWIDKNVIIYPIPFVKTNFRDLNREKKKIIIFAAKFSERKNPILFANAVKQLFSENKLNLWNIFIRGKGPLESDIRTILNTKIKEGKVKVGFTNNLDEELYHSKIFVSVIRTGNYPSQSAFEAYGNGNLLVLSDTGNTKEKFTHNNFIFVDPTIESVKKGLLQATEIAETQNFSEISKSIQDKLISDYNNEIVMDTLFKLYGNRTHEDV